MNAAQIVTRDNETLKDDKGRLIGWIAVDGRFQTCGAALSADQLRAILAMLAK